MVYLPVRVVLTGREKKCKSGVEGLGQCRGKVEGHLIGTVRGELEGHAHRTGAVKGQC